MEIVSSGNPAPVGKGVYVATFRVNTSGVLTVQRGSIFASAGNFCRIAIDNPELHELRLKLGDNGSTVFDITSSTSTFAELVYPAETSGHIDRNTMSFLVPWNRNSGDGLWVSLANTTANPRTFFNDKESTTITLGISDNQLSAEVVPGGNATGTQTALSRLVYNDAGRAKNIVNLLADGKVEFIRGFTQSGSENSWFAITNAPGHYVTVLPSGGRDDIGPKHIMNSVSTLTGNGLAVNYSSDDGNPYEFRIEKNQPVRYVVKIYLRKT